MHSHTGNYLCMGLRRGSPESIKPATGWEESPGLPSSQEHDAVQTRLRFPHSLPERSSLLYLRNGILCSILSEFDLIYQIC